MAITTLDQLVAGMTAGGERAHFGKLGVTQGTTGLWTSFWKAPGWPGGASATPGAAATCDRTTTGALKFTNPAVGKGKYLSMLDIASTQRGSMALYDRLVHNGNLSGITTGAQTVNTPTLPARDSGGATNGDDVELWLEIYTAIGTTVQTVTASYTNQAGTAGQTTTAVNVSGSGLQQANRMIPLPLAAGDTGVRSVQSVTLSGSTGTAGAFGVTLLRRIALMDMPQTNTSWGKGFTELGLPQLYSDSCLSLMGLFDASTSANVYGEVAYATEQ